MPGMHGSTMSRLTKIDVEHAGLTSHDLSSGEIRLFREKHIFLLHLGHNIGMSLDLFVVKTFATDYFTHLNESGRGALKTDNRIPWLHLANTS
jgi:hypothetical protein